MTAVYPLAEAQTKLSRLFAEAADHLVCVRDGEQVLGYLLAPQQADEWEAKLETSELLANPQAVKALTNAQQGRTIYQPLSALDDEA